MILSCDQHLHNYLKCPKIEQFYFRFLFCFKIDHVLITRGYLKCPTFKKIFEIFEMPHFVIFRIKKEKMGHFKYFEYSNIRKWGISNNQHVINFKTEKELKMKFFDFGAFRKIMKMVSHTPIFSGTPLQGFTQENE